ncbi:tumor necrosis factor receptor superfamily member 14-like isoform X2 [Lepisosteus oculatus]|uniref:tumor necrosis factor receptor superfamily member 14-like isoform X2 n=1 Tax=Lepisosteus oculatus TaxID=7918 RepID=UPI00371D31B5
MKHSAISSLKPLKILSPSVVIFLLALFHGFAVGKQCGPAEYKVNGECCPMCPAGSRVLHHCTEFKSTTCIPCVGSTYIDQSNRLSTCLQCKVCDPGLGLQNLSDCTSTRNRLCRVLIHYYCTDKADGDCRAARPHTVCKPGQRIKKQGTETSDTECEDCPEETYSPHGIECTRWTDCAVLGKVKMKDGSSTDDVSCQKKSPRPHIGTVVVFALWICAVVYLFTRARLCCSEKCPIQETNRGSVAQQLGNGSFLTGNENAATQSGGIQT